MCRGILHHFDIVRLGESHVLLLAVAVDEGESRAVALRGHMPRLMLLLLLLLLKLLLLELLLLLLQLVRRVLAPTVPHGRTHGCVVPAGMQMAGLPVSLGALPPAADEEEAANGGQTDDEHKAENRQRNEQREILHGKAGRRRRCGIRRRRGRQSRLRENARRVDGKRRAGRRKEVAVVPNGLDDYLSGILSVQKSEEKKETTHAQFAI